MVGNINRCLYPLSERAAIRQHVFSRQRRFANYEKEEVYGAEENSIAMRKWLGWYDRPGVKWGVLDGGPEFQGQFV
jgi:hypothetical protein